MDFVLSLVTCVVVLFVIFVNNLNGNEIMFYATHIGALQSFVSQGLNLRTTMIVKDAFCTLIHYLKVMIVTKSLDCSKGEYLKFFLRNSFSIYPLSISLYVFSYIKCFGFLIRVLILTKFWITYMYLVAKWDATIVANELEDTDCINKMQEVISEKIPTKIVSVLLEENDSDCGLFLLYYILKFVKDPPKTINIKDLEGNYMDLGVVPLKFFIFLFEFQLFFNSLHQFYF